MAFVETKRNYGFTVTDENSREYAEEKLFGSRVSNTQEAFKNDYATSAYQELVENNYAQEPSVDVDFNSPMFNSYITNDNNYTNPLEQQYNPYDVADATYMNTQTEQINETRPSQAKPIFNPYDSPYYQPKGMEWEIQVNEDQPEDKEEYLQMPAVREESNLIVSAKLNSRGVVMAVAFSIIMALLTALLIVNVTSINASQSNISYYTNAIEQTLATTAALEQQYAAATDTDSIEQAATDAGYVSPESGLLTVVTLPDTNIAAPSAEASDQTNWFDRFVDFVSGMFA